VTTQNASLAPSNFSGRFRGWLAPQVLLAAAFVLSFIFAVIQVNTVWEGLPMHPLLVHVPVILIPTVGVGTLIVVFRQEWFERHSLWLAAVSVVALGALDLTLNAGNSLRNDLDLYGNSTVDSLINRHANAASILQIFTIAFTVALIVTIAIDLHSRGRRTGVGALDAVAGLLLTVLRSVRTGRVIVGLLALGCLYFVFLTGDLGARAVWQGRIAAAQHAQPAG